SPNKMFLGILHWLSVPKISALVLRWIFYYSKVLGVSYFHLKTTNEGKLQIKDSNPGWKWFHAIYRFGVIILYLYLYIFWIIDITDLVEIALNSCRMIINIFCSLCMLRLQINKGQELADLINRYLRLFQRVRDICQPKRMGFGGKQELILLSLMMITLIHEKVFVLGIIKLVKEISYNIGWVSDVYLSLGNQLLMHFAFVWYLALGLQFSDLNEFVRTQLRFQLDGLEAKPNRKKLREARRTLDKCLTLYQDLLSLTSQFQRIYDLIFFLALIQNCFDIVVLSYKIVVLLQRDWFWLWSGTFFKIINMIILCLSVHRAMLQFRVIRSLMVENCYLSDIRDWQRTLDMFFTYLNLYELQVCPLGLFQVSNELLLVFLSALVNYFTVILQYGMQQKVV
ncbi:hypothetical protein KR032_008892, partial [Drosophila birchii]